MQNGAEWTSKGCGPCAGCLAEAQRLDGSVEAGRLVWQGETTRSIADALEGGREDADSKTATSEAADWLDDYLTQEGGRADSADIKRDGVKAGHSIDALKRARRKLGIETASAGFPRRTEWVRPVGASTPPVSAHCTNCTNWA